jgi:hypothetical protein
MTSSCQPAARPCRQLLPSLQAPVTFLQDPSAVSLLQDPAAGTTCPPAGTTYPPAGPFCSYPPAGPFCSYPPAGPSCRYLFPNCRYLLPNCRYLLPNCRYLLPSCRNHAHRPSCRTLLQVAKLTCRNPQYPKMVHREMILFRPSFQATCNKNNW